LEQGFPKVFDSRTLDSPFNLTNIPESLANLLKDTDGTLNISKDQAVHLKPIFLVAHSKLELLNNEDIESHISPTFPRSLIPRVDSKKFVQQGRSHFCAQSVWIIREHRKMARTPLTAFFNRPKFYLHRWEQIGYDLRYLPQLC